MTAIQLIDRRLIEIISIEFSSFQPGLNELTSSSDSGLVGAIQMQINGLSDESIKSKQKASGYLANVIGD